MNISDVLEKELQDALQSNALLIAENRRLKEDKQALARFLEDLIFECENDERYEDMTPKGRKLLDKHKSQS